jgi:RNA polymerase sigma-70 factor (ECF subfamily)
MPAMAGIDPALEDAVRERLTSGDAAAAATTALRGYGPEVLGYLNAVLRDEVRADEAFSAFCEDLWRGLEGFRWASSFRTWVYKLAWHAAVRTAREPFRKRAAPLETTAAGALAQEVRSATAPHLRTEVKTSIQKLRESLTAEEQTLLVLRVDRQLGWKDVADVLEIDAASARKRYERVKEKLRDLAKAHGIGEA